MQTMQEVQSGAWLIDYASQLLRLSGTQTIAACTPIRKRKRFIYQSGSMAVQSTQFQAEQEQFGRASIRRYSLKTRRELRTFLKARKASTQLSILRKRVSFGF